MTRSRAASYWTAFAVIVGMAAILRFWGLDMGLPHLMTRPDEEVILVETRAPATGTFDLKYGIYPSAYIFLSWGWGELGHAALKAAGLNKAVSYAQAIAETTWRILIVLRALSAFATRCG
jgi:hypothetical protein